MVKVTVYIPVHNYGRFLRQAIESVLSQKYGDWELIVIDDGSTDNTPQILADYERHPRITIVRQERKGLPVSNNVALRLARGDYFIRLDADDYLDENALVVLANVLDAHPEVGLVYPDYYTVNEEGEILEIHRRKKAHTEVTLFDIPAHGACTMIRKSCLLELGGYSEDIDRQDGYDLWIRFVDRFQVYNVNLPLFYYRRHGRNLTEDRRALIEARHRINRRHVQQKFGAALPKVLGIIPARGADADAFDAPLASVAGQPLLHYTLEEAQRAAVLDRVVLTSDDENVLACAASFDRISTVQRPEELSRPNTRIEPTVLHVLRVLAERDGYRPDAVMLLYINAPLRRAEHIEKAVDTMLIFKVDSVVSVCEDLGFHYHHRREGLVPLSDRRLLRLEREALYEENGAVYLSRREAITPERFLGDRLGHIVMLPEESVQIDSAYERWLVEQTLASYRVTNAYRAG